MGTLRIVGLVALCLAVVGTGITYFRNPDLDTVILYLLAVGGLLTLDLFAGKSSKPEQGHDAELFKAFRKDLPFEPSIHFIATNWLSATFALKELYPIDEFRLRWVDAAHEFENQELNQLLKELRNTAKDLMELVALTTWRIGEGHQTTKTQGEKPAVWEARGRALDAAAAKVVAAHQALERVGRRVLSSSGRSPYRNVASVVVGAALLAFPAYGPWRAERQRANELADSLGTARRERDAGASASLQTIQSERDTLRAELSRKRSKEDVLRWQADHLSTITCSNDKTTYGGVVIETSGYPLTDLRAEWRVIFEALPTNKAGHSGNVRYLMPDYFAAPLRRDRDNPSRYLLAPGTGWQAAGSLTSAIVDALNGEGFSWGGIEARPTIRMTCRDLLGQEREELFSRDWAQAEFHRVAPADWSRARKTADSLRASGRVIRFDGTSDRETARRVARECVVAATKAN